MQRYFTLRPSRLLALLLLLLSAASLATLWLLAPRTAAFTVPAAVVLSWAFYCLLRDARLRFQHSCVAFRLDGGGEIVLVLRSGKHLPGRMSADSLVTPYLIILNIVPNEQLARRSLVILPDAMGAEHFRRLSVVLRWSAPADQGAAV